MFIDLYAAGNRRIASEYYEPAPRTLAEIVQEAAVVVSRHAPKGAYAIIVNDRGAPEFYFTVTDAVLGRLGVIPPGLALTRTREHVHAMRMRAS